MIGGMVGVGAGNGVPASRRPREFRDLIPPGVGVGAAVVDKAVDIGVGSGESEMAAGVAVGVEEAPVVSDGKDANSDTHAVNISSEQPTMIEPNRLWNILRAYTA